MVDFTRAFARAISKQMENRLDNGGHKETEQFCQRIGKIVPPSVAQFDYTQIKIKEIPCFEKCVK